MSTALAIVRRRPVLSYFALTFAISWGGIAVLARTFGVGVMEGSGDSAGGVEQVGPLTALALLMWFAGPSLSSVLLTAALDGRSGLRELRSRILRWRVGARWYAAALVPAPLIIAAVLFALSSRSADYVPAIVTTDHKATLLVLGIG